MKVLVVDDQLTNRKLLRAQLEALGHQVVDAEDGLAAMDVLDRELVDAVVSDILMPRMDGYRFCYEVRRHKKYSQLPFVFYTAGYTAPSDEKLALEMGADAYLRKPVSTEAICLALQSATHASQRGQPESHFSDTTVLKEYSERLVCRLEEKNAELRVQAEALRQSDSRLRAIIATEPECVKVLGPDGMLLEMNPAGLRMIEADSFQQVKEQCVYSLVVKEDRERFRAFNAQVFAGVSGVLEFDIVGLKGARRTLETHASPLRDAIGRVTALIGVTRDITERRRAEEQLRQTHKLQAIGQLAGGVAHDFNNILGAILGNADLALADLHAGHPAIENLEAIREAGSRAKTLVRQMMIFSRREPPRRHVLALGSLVEEAARLLRATLPASVELVTTIASGTPNILADTTQIHQLLFNLCTNAWHALGSQPGRIEIALKTIVWAASDPGKPPGLEPGCYAALFVHDTGSGMDPQTLARAFEPFFTTKEPGKGSGLGLSVVHGIVESHEGAIHVDSRLGGGTTFRLYFPVVEVKLQVVATPAGMERRGAGQRILYLDDEEPLVLLARRMLERLGYRVSGFSRPPDALKAFRENPAAFDLIVTDMNMPGSTGLDVAREIHAIRPEVSVVLISGHVTDELKQRAKSAGIRDVLYKPTSMTEFSEAIHRLTTVT